MNERIHLPTVRSTGPTLFLKKKLTSISEGVPRYLPKDTIDVCETCRLEMAWKINDLNKVRKMQFTLLATPIDCWGMTRPGAMVTWSMYSVPTYLKVDKFQVWLENSVKTCRWSCLPHIQREYYYFFRLFMAQQNKYRVKSNLSRPLPQCRVSASLCLSGYRVYQLQSRCLHYEKIIWAVLGGEAHSPLTFPCRW